MGRVSKSHNFVLACSETEAKFIFDRFKDYPLLSVPFQLFDTSLAFFIWSINYLREFFGHFIG